MVRPDLLPGPRNLGGVIELRTPGELDAMRAAGAVVADMLAAVRAAAAPGRAAQPQLDAVARDVLAAAGATSPFLGYAPLSTTPPFPGVVCLSVNDVALHGIPTPDALDDGDLLSVDAGATLDGWVGDAAITFPVGTPRPEDLRLVATAERGAGRRASPRPSSATASATSPRPSPPWAAPAGAASTPTRAATGSAAPCTRRRTCRTRAGAGRGVPLRAGLVIAIEPWFLAGGSDDYRVDADGWTLRSADGSRAAHVEHTVAVTDDGPRILTLPS